MSRATCYPLHLLYFATPALGLILIMNKDNLPYVSGVVFFFFVALSVGGVSSSDWERKKGAKFCVLRSISTDYLNQAERGRYEIQ